MKQKDELDPQLRKMLEALKNVPERDPARAEAGRAQFLKLAEQMKPRVALAAPPKRSWWQKIADAFGVRSAGMRLAQGIVAVLLLAVVVLGGGVMVARAAYNSLPGEPLYPVKQVLEDGEILLAFSPARKAELHLEIAQERLVELQILSRRGDTALAAKVAADLEAHLRAADALSNKIADRETSRELARLRSLAEAAERMTANSMSFAPPTAEGHLRRAHQFAAEIVKRAHNRPTPTARPSVSPTKRYTTATPLPPTPTVRAFPTFHFSGAIESINDGMWVIGGVSVVIDQHTNIHGTAEVGAWATVHGYVNANGQKIAVQINITTPTATQRPRHTPHPTVTPFPTPTTNWNWWHTPTPTPASTSEPHSTPHPTKTPHD